MKLNWGKGIAILYTTFVLFIAVMVYMAFGEKYDLVTEDYYQKEIEFQSTIDKKDNAKRLTSKLKVGIQDSKVLLDFPQKNSLVEGVVHVFRPSDETLDFEQKFSVQNGIVEMELKQFVSGKYIIKTDWRVDEKDYYQEQTVVIP